MHIEKQDLQSILIRSLIAEVLRRFEDFIKTVRVESKLNSFDRKHSYTEEQSTGVIATVKALERL